MACGPRMQALMKLWVFKLLSMRQLKISLISHSRVVACLKSSQRFACQIEEHSLTDVDEMDKLHIAIPNHRHETRACQQRVIGMLGIDPASRRRRAIAKVGLERGRLHPIRHVNPGKVENRRAEIE